MLAVVVLAVLLQGCQDGSSVSIPSTASTSRSSGSLSPEEVARQTGYSTSSDGLTPVYALVPEFRDPSDGYARDLLAEKCLEGIVEYRAVEPVASEVFDERTGQGIFNSHVAEVWGYPHLRSWDTEDSAVPDSVVITDEIHAELVKCGEAADRRLGWAPDDYLVEVEAAGWEAFNTSAEMRSVEDAWRLCMAPSGVKDLPQSPRGMPPESIVPGPSISGEGGLVGTVELTEEERQLAIFDAHCRESVGYDETGLRVRANAELSYIGKDLGLFEAARDEYEIYGLKIHEVLAEFD